MSLINYSKASDVLTRNRKQIRSNYSGKKYKQAIKELKDFEKDWINKHCINLKK